MKKNVGKGPVPSVNTRANDLRTDPAAVKIIREIEEG